MTKLRYRLLTFHIKRSEYVVSVIPAQVGIQIKR